MDDDHHLSFPTVSRSGRILKKSTRWIEAEESILTQADQILSQNEPDSLIDVVQSFDVIDNDVKKESEMFDSKSLPCSSRSTSVSSTTGDETSVSFKGTFPYRDVVNKVSYRKIFDFQHHLDSTRSNSFSSMDEGETCLKGTLHHFGRRNTVLHKKLFDVNHSDATCSTSYSSVGEDEARKTICTTFSRYDMRSAQNKKMLNFDYCPDSTYPNSFYSIGEHKAYKSFTGSPDGMRSILSKKVDGLDSEIRPDSPRTISISSTEEDDERISSFESSPGSESSRETMSSPECHPHDEKSQDLLWCHKRDSNDHRYCTRFRLAQKSGLMDIATNIPTRNPPINCAQNAAKSGTTNVTAYRLWSSLNRRVISATNMHLPKQQISKKVREAWQALPAEEKQFWARKAIELSERMQAHSTCSDSEERAVVRKNLTYKQPRKKREEDGFPNWKKNMRRNYEEEHVLNCDAPWKNGTRKKKCEEQHVLGIAPVDAAAHLKLLGDSMTRIGRGILMANIEPSPAGAYSVLLDSLLCSVGALLCLTREIPGLEQLPEAPFKKTLDHVAYFFPGL